MRLQVATVILIPILSSYNVVASSESWKLDREYFHDVNISCTDSDEINHTVNVQLWVLPSGDTIRPDESTTDNHVMVSENGMLLRIFKLDDADFGLYLCIYTDENRTNIIKKGINLDGPFYGEEIVNSYKRKAVVGGICAGVAFGIIFIACLVCSLCKHSGHDDIEKGTKIEKTNKNGIPTTCMVVADESKGESGDLSTTIGGSIYDTADGLLRNTVDNEANHVTETLSGKDVESVQSDSGHYQSIGSLERDAKPPSNLSVNDERVQTPETEELQTESETELKSYIKTPRQSYSDNDSSAVTDESESSMRHDSVDSDTLGDEQLGEANLDESSDSKLDGDHFLTMTENDNQQVIYAKPVRNRQKPNPDKTDVTIVEGEVIIEPSGLSVPVTTAPPVFTDQHVDNLTALMTRKSERDNCVDDNAKHMTDRAKNMSEAIDIGTDAGNINIEREQDSTFLSVPVIGNMADISASLIKKQESVSEPYDVEENTRKITTDDPLSNESSPSINEACDETDGSPKANQKQKMSSISSTCSETSKSTVDDETVANFDNVLASLQLTQKRNSADDKADDHPVENS